MGTFDKSAKRYKDEFEKWKNHMTPDQEEPPDDFTELSSDDVRDHGTQLKMLYAQQGKSNQLSHALIEQCEKRFIHTFVD